MKDSNYLKSAKDNIFFYIVYISIVAFILFISIEFFRMIRPLKIIGILGVIGSLYAIVKYPDVKKHLDKIKNK